MKKLAILVLTLAAPAAAIAQDTTATADPNEVICRVERATGSRVALSRRCATRAQWLADQRQQQANAQERTLRQVNPQYMNAAERARAAGRSVNVGGHPVPQ